MTTTTTYQGRSGLDVTWNTAEFIDAGNPGLTSSISNNDDPLVFSQSQSSTMRSPISWWSTARSKPDDIDHTVALGDGGNAAKARLR